MNDAASSTISTLTDDDRQLFERLRIDEHVLERARVRRVNATDAARILGRPVAHDLGGLHFQYCDPRTGQPNATSAIRRDHPPVGADGKPQGKYLFTSGRSHIYFPPDAESRIKDAAVPLIIVEAQKSVLAIECVLRRAGRVGLPVGINGCWGWHGTIGKATAADGTRIDEKGVLPDFRALCLPQREVVVMLDANVASNDKVKAAERRLIALLKSYEMNVRVVRVPEAPGVNGPDDYIASHPDDAVLGLLDGASVAERVKPSRGAAATELLHLVHAGG